MVLCCHVYEQCIAEPPEYLQVAEVGAAGWAPLESIVSNAHVAPLEWRDDAGEQTPWDGYPAVRLPIADQDLWLADTGTGPQPTKAEVKPRFQLWGLTLDLVNELMLESGLRENKIDHDLLSRL